MPVSGRAAKAAGHLAPNPAPPAHRRWGVIALLALGGIAAALTSKEFAIAHGWADAPGATISSAIVKDWALSLAIVALAAGAALVPPIRGGVVRLTERLRQPSPAWRTRAALAIAILAAMYLAMSAELHQRAMFPTAHDEQMYLLQARMLAGGKLWMPAHPLADSFETFYVLTRPVYAPIYFPGAALMNVPAVWMGWPTWLMPVLLAGLCVGLMYRIVTELVDGVAGLLAALLLPSLGAFRWSSIMVMSHGAGLFLALALIYAWLKWRSSPKLWRAAMIGALAGWYAITRPVDALCVAGPIGIAIFLDLRKQNWTARLTTIALAILSAAPFLGLQLIFNHGVTGHFFQTPVGLYNAQFSPQVSLGLGKKVDPSFRPKTHLLQKQMLYTHFILPLEKELNERGLPRQLIESRLPMVAGASLPAAVLLVLLPAGFLGTGDRRRWVLWAALLAYLLVMMGFFAMLRQYCIFAIPAAVLAALAGMRIVQETWPGSAFLRAWLLLAVLGLAIAGFPEIAGTDRMSYAAEWPVMATNYQMIPGQVQPPAIVMIRYHPDSHFDEEPVYNLDAAWPDDAPIIRAHLLDAARNRELLSYYAQRQPERQVYVLDRKDMTLRGPTSVKKMEAEVRAATTQPGP